MSNIIWPSQFPLPTQTFSADNTPSVLRTTMDSGRFRQRRRFTTDHTVVDVSWEFTDTELGVFEAFCQYRLQQCSARFVILLPLGGTGIQPHIARFIEGKYKITYVPVHHWRVTAQLEVEEVKRFDDATLEVYLELGFNESQIDNLISLIDYCHDVIHFQYPANTSLTP